MKPRIVWMSLFAVLLIPRLAHSAESGNTVVKPTSPTTEILTVVPTNMQIGSKGWVSAISADNRYAAIAYEAATGSPERVVVTELATGKLLLDEKFPNHIISIAISPGAQWLAVNDSGNIYNTKSQLLHIPTRRIAALPFNVRDMKFSPDGTHLAIGDMASGVVVLDCKSGRNIGQFQVGNIRNGPWVNRLTFSPDGKKLFADVGNGDIYRLNADTLQQLGDAWLGMGAYQIAFSPDSRRLAVARKFHDSVQIVMLDAETGILLNSPASVRGDDQIQAMTFTPDGHYLFTISEKGIVALWDGTIGEMVGQKNLSQPYLVYPHFSQDAKHLYAFEVGKSWDISIATVAPQQPRGTPRATAQVALPTRSNFEKFDATLESAVFNSDSGLLVIGAWWNLIFVKGKETWPSNEVIKPAREQGEGPTAIVSVAISRDGRRATAAPDYAAMVVCDVATGNLVSLVSDSVEYSHEYGRPHTFMPDGTLAIPWKHGIRIVDAAKGSTLRRLKYQFDGNISVVAAGTTKPWLAVGTSNGSLFLARTDTSNAPVVMQQIHKGAVTTAVFSPHDSLVAAGGADGNIRLFETATGNPASAVWAAHADAVTSISFSSDGKYLASGSADGTVRVWNVSTGQPVTYALAGHSEPVLAVMFDASTGQLSSVGHDSILRRWTIPTK